MSIVGPNGKIGKIVGPNGPVGKVVGPNGTVWTSELPIVEITGTSGTTSRDQFRAALSERGLDYATVTELPFLLDTSKATDLNNLFASCRNLVTVPPMSTGRVTNMRSMFDYCHALTSVPDLDARALMECRYMFWACHNLVDGKVRLQRWGTDPPQDTGAMIASSGLTEPPFYSYDSWGNYVPIIEVTGQNNDESRDKFRSALESRGYSFQSVTILPFLIDTSKATNTVRMFHNCSSLTHVPHMDTRQVTNMGSMYEGCRSLVEAPNIVTSKATIMEALHRGCQSLVTSPAYDTSNITSMKYMFDDCRKLTSVPDLETTGVTDVSYMFRWCTLLKNGNVRLMLDGYTKPHTRVSMIANSGLGYEPFYNSNNQRRVY